MKVKYNTSLNCPKQQAINPDVKVNKGQTIALTCEIDVNGVLKKDITWSFWSNDGSPITAGVSEDKFVHL